MQPCIVYYISKPDSLTQCLLMLGRGRRRWVYIKSTASRVWSELIWGWGNEMNRALGHLCAHIG